MNIIITQSSYVHNRKVCYYICSVKAHVKGIAEKNNKVQVMNKKARVEKLRINLVRQQNQK